MSQVYAAMSSMSMSIRGREAAAGKMAASEEDASSSSSNTSFKKGEDAAVEFSKKRDE